MERKKKTKKLDGGQLLLTVTDKRQTRRLVREVAQQKQDSKIQTEIMSDRKSNSGLDAKTC
jgi:TusA-related sulfurtransferase